MQSSADHPVTRGLQSRASPGPRTFGVCITKCGSRPFCEEAQFLRTRIRDAPNVVSMIAMPSNSPGCRPGRSVVLKSIALLCFAAGLVLAEVRPHALPFAHVLGTCSDGTCLSPLSPNGLMCAECHRRCRTSANATTATSAMWTARLRREPVVPANG